MPASRSRESYNRSLDIELLKELCDTAGVSGFEGPVQDIVERAVRDRVDEIRRDRLGNLIAVRRARRTSSGRRPPKVMFAAHADEVGFMVTHVDEDGFVWFAPIGGHDPVVIMSQRVVIHGREPVQGVIAPRIRGRMKPGDFQKAPALTDLFVDCARPKREMEKLVRIGDHISLVQATALLNDHTVTGKAFDDRLGVFCMIEALRMMENNDADVYAVSTVQEEVGVRGAGVAAYAIQPDLGIAVDGGLAWDVASTPEHDRRCRVGAGTGIYIMDNLTIGDRKLVEFLAGLCEAERIPYQRNVGGGTDASAIQRNASGAFATTIGAPTRYMHSTVQVADLADLEATARLLAASAEHASERDWS